MNISNLFLSVVMAFIVSIILLATTSGSNPAPDSGLFTQVNNKNK